jgi:hypothetical protein
VILQVEDLRGATHVIAFWQGFDEKDKKAYGKVCAACPTLEVCMC